MNTLTSTPILPVDDEIYLSMVTNGKFTLSKVATMQVYQKKNKSGLFPFPEEHMSIFDKDDNLLIDLCSKAGRNFNVVAIRTHAQLGHYTLALTPVGEAHFIITNSNPNRVLERWLTS